MFSADFAMYGALFLPLQARVRAHDVTFDWFEVEHYVGVCAKFGS